MADVLSFPQRERKIWVCRCGCSTFELLSDKSVRCAMCQVESSNEGGWTPSEERPDWDGETPIRTVQGNGDVDFARRLTVRRASEDDVSAIVVVKEGGGISVWANIQTQDQLDWLDKQLEQASELFATALKEQE